MTFDRSCYGWTSSSPRVLQRRLKAAGERFAVLRETLGFDSIAFTGSSGCCAGFTLALQHPIPLIYVRKDGEQSHGSAIEFNMHPLEFEVHKYLIVDDFVAGGGTVRSIVDKIDAHVKSKLLHYHPLPVGVLCFTKEFDAEEPLRIICGRSPKTGRIVVKDIPIFGTKINQDEDTDTSLYDV